MAPRVSAPPVRAAARESLLVAEERKLVTILFADVTGSTALGEALDPEDVRALMARYYQHARRIIPEHGGTLEKFIGDAVMAVFGLPHAHGNDAERALLAAALAVREAVAADSLLGGRLLLQLGVNTSEVVASRDPAGGDFLVTGDAVNVAARLQQTANPGEILAGERTVAAARASFHFGGARAIEVKGKSAPLTIFPLTGPRPAREHSRPPLVGGQRELAQLGLLRDAALEERHPQLVSIVAPAGTGKTRLLEEFLAGLDPADGWQVATARCLPYGQSLTYWPLRALLDELLGAAFSPERVRTAFVAGGQDDTDAERLTGVLDLSIGSRELGTGADIENTDALTRLVFETMRAAGATVGIGRYDEPRPIYTSDAYRVEGNDGPEWRTLHTAIDLFMTAGSPIFAPLDGVVHSFQNNAAPRDYGPTIVLEHTVADANEDGALIFYTLYGHLSLDSLDGLYEGKPVARGERIAHVGDEAVNGQWPPHLHFQIIADLLGKRGNYPGVALQSQRETRLSLSPDPNMMLGIEEKAAGVPLRPGGMSAVDILAARSRRIGRNLSVAYRAPLVIVRGYLQHLYDETGRKYLDAVNNARRPQSSAGGARGTASDGGAQHEHTLPARGPRALRRAPLCDAA
jgi:class 3 adenylate cyclase/murein DD-endopeptidase MepM/ murein hydrolase activator NlpD